MDQLMEMLQLQQMQQVQQHQPIYQVDQQVRFLIKRVLGQRLSLRLEQAFWSVVLRLVIQLHRHLLEQTSPVRHLGFRLAVMPQLQRLQQMSLVELSMLSRIKMQQVQQYS